LLKNNKDFLSFRYCNLQAR